MEDTDQETGQDESVGALLRSYRQKEGLRLEKVAHVLRIRQHFLEAIEEERYWDLPGPIYASGFVRAYAEYLGLNGKDFVRRLKFETAALSEDKQTSVTAPPPEAGPPTTTERTSSAPSECELRTAADADVWSGFARSAQMESGQEAIDADPAEHGQARGKFFPPFGDAHVPRDFAGNGGRTKGVVLLSGVLLALAAYGIWHVLLPHDLPQGERVALSPNPFEPASGTGQRAPTDQLPAIREDQAPSAAATNPLAAASTEAGDSSAPAGPRSVAARNSQEGGRGPVAAPPITSPSGSPARILLRARADTWIEITDDRAKKVIYAKLLRAGDSHTVPDRPGLKLLVGNAGGLEVVIDGTLLSPLGRDGVVQRNLPLEPHNLRAAAARGQ